MGAAWRLPSWMEDTDLTISTNSAFFMWLLTRGAGFNITLIAKRIDYFSVPGPTSQPKFSQQANKYNPRKRIQEPPDHTEMGPQPYQMIKEASYKFHSLSINDGSMLPPIERQLPVAVNYAQAVVPRRQYGELCYTHVVPRDTPPHRLPLTAQDVTENHQGCPGVASPYETVTAPRTVTVHTADGRHRPMLETQIYSVYPTTNKSVRDVEELTASTSTQTDAAHRRQLVNTESLPAVESECLSHYWNWSDSYPDLPSVHEFPPVRANPNITIYASATDADRGNSSNKGTFSQSEGYSRFRMPMIYFYHY